MSDGSTVFREDDNRKGASMRYVHALRGRNNDVVAVTTPYEMEPKYI